MKKEIRILQVISGDLWAGAEVQAYTLVVQLHRIPEVRVAVVALNSGVLSAKLRELGIGVEVVDETQQNAVQIARRLRQIIQDWRPDVIHVHRDKENILAAIANWFSLKVPSIRTVHGGDEHRGSTGWRAVRRRLASGLDQCVQRTSDQTIIAVSEDLGTQLSERVPWERIVVIENGVDIEGVRSQVSASENQLLDKCRTHIGIVGRLVAVKRVDIFLEMAMRLIKEHPHRRWSFDVFGEGPERSRLSALRDRLAISGSVTFHGHRHDIAACIAQLDVLVMCSDHEGMPMAALEAAALGVPTVAHAVGGLVYAVPKEFQVRRHDADGYREGVLRALCTDARGIALRHASKTLQQLSAKRNAARTLRLYRRVTLQGAIRRTLD